MSCAAGPANFRLLDAFVGWDPFDHKNLSGLEDPDGLRLALLVPGVVDPAVLLGFFPPPRLARGCGPCEWFLVTPAPPESLLLRREPCTGLWKPVWQGCPRVALVDAVAVAAHRSRLAVADRGAGAALLFSGNGERLAGEIKIEKPGPLAFTPWGELLVTQEGSTRILRFGPTGDYLGHLAAEAPGPIDRIAVGDDCAIWLVTREKGAYKLWRTTRDGEAFERASVADLPKSLRPTGLVAASDLGFCIEEPGPGGIPVVHCYSWYGRPLSSGEIPRPAKPKRQTHGQLLTLPIDSGIPRCRWHRVRVDADVPPGTTLSVAVSTAEEESLATPQGDPAADPEWSAFPAGVPHPFDWHSAPAGSLDYLIDQPPGRYLFLRVRLTGDAVATPVVRRVRIDLPRSTSLDYLPPVYRENAEAEDFSERFLSLFDAVIEDLDRAIIRYPALLDPTGVPDELLPWLSSFLDIVPDQAWDADQRREILRAAPRLYQRRGTVAGMIEAIRLVFRVEPAIQELAQERLWGALGSSRVRAVRLFGKARARFRVGSSALCQAPLRSYGNPDQDPLATHAHRFRVLIPPSALVGTGRERLERLVEAVKPAHTIASLRVGGDGFLVGSWTSIGIDTSFTPLPAPILGRRGNVRLRRASVLWRRPGAARPGLVVGQGAVIGSQLIME
jgi:phage tail-like protein